MPKLNPNPDTESQGAGPQPHPPELPKEALLLRLFVGEDDRHKHLPLYEAIVLKARELHLAGATVLRGPLGFGRSSHMHSAKILRLSTDLPMVIEIVDTQDKIDAFLPHLEQMMSGGLVTLERVQVIHYREEHFRKSVRR
jgi:PII-like signaling protein